MAEEKIDLHGKQIVESCTVVDAVHAAILSSKPSLNGEIQCQYLGLTARQQPLKGFLQSRPCAWRLEFKSDDENKKRVIYISISSNEKGVDCLMPNVGKFKMMIVDDSGNDATIMVVKLRDGNIGVGELIQNWMKNFSSFADVWPRESK